MKIHCLIENTTSSHALIAEHGLSLLIEACGKRILFDMGASPAFASNAERLGIDLQAVDAAIISHGHYDHGGGLPRFLELNSHAPIRVAPHAFDPHFNASGRDIGLNATLSDHPRIKSTTKPSYQLAPGLTLIAADSIPGIYPAEGTGMSTETGGVRVPDDFRHEQYLFIEETGQRVLISGCSHRGILNIATHFRADALIGGFHLMNADPVSEAQRLTQIADTLRELPTIYYTGHCTGDAAFALLKSRMGAQLHAFSTGQLIEI